MSLLSINDLFIAEMNFDTEPFDHPDYPLGIYQICDECPHVGQLETARDPVCFNFGRNRGLAQEGTVEIKTKGGSSVADDYRYSKII